MELVRFQAFEIGHLIDDQWLGPIVRPELFNLLIRSVGINYVFFNTESQSFLK